MLFDLQAKGRRRVIKVIYASLAVLMGAGLVLFGIGGSVSGGLFDAFKDEQQSTSDVFQKKVDSAQKRVDANPTLAAAWANLAKVRYQNASAGTGFDQANGVFTAEGKAELAKVDRAWAKYLSLKPEKPDVSTARLMVQAYGPGGLEQYDKAVDAQELVVNDGEPQVGPYVTYAQLAYLAGQNRKGDLAGKKAQELAPKDQREQVKANIDAAKQAAAQQAVQKIQQESGSGAAQLPGG